ncbi:MAG: hypothetical protein ACRDG5_05595 [Anaerolineales bacterium]
MDYGGTLKRTWQITWRNKAWWVLGILASCSGSGRGGGGTQWNMSRFDERELEGANRALNGLLQSETFWIILGVAILIVLLLSLLFLALGVIGQGGLIAAFHKADRDTILTIGQAFQHGVEKFGASSPCS